MGRLALAGRFSAEAAGGALSKSSLLRAVDRPLIRNPAVLSAYENAELTLPAQKSRRTDAGSLLDTGRSRPSGIRCPSASIDRAP